MKRNLIILLLTMLCGAGLTYLLDYAHNKPSAVSLPEEPVNVKSEPVPDFSFETLESTEASIDDLRGKIVVLNFWASWCAPCVKEFPLLLETALTHKDEVILLALSSDHDMGAMTRFLDKMRSAHPEAMKAQNVMIAVDENSAITQDIFQTFRLPETIIIDGKGIMREKLIGADWNYEDINKIITMIGDNS